MTSHEAFQAGRLTEAIELATDTVRNSPTDTDARSFLAVLLCFAGEWERADKQLDSVKLQSTELAIGISLVRQLIRAEQARDDFFNVGRVPEVTNEPSEHLQLTLRASVEQREGKLAEAAVLIASAEEKRPTVTGAHGEQEFSGIRDLDDLLAGVCEVLTSNGKYYLVPFDQIVLLEFKPPEKPLDLLWRQARMIVDDGPDGEVYIPVLYHSSSVSGDEQLRMGRATDWVGDDSGPVRGVGQRELLLGDDTHSLLALGTITRQDGSKS
ncbi:MAG: type VI secretion system protein ImpE [Planctomycetaceae bacterium]|jgi:type VI secretion system protein ImpE